MIQNDIVLYSANSYLAYYISKNYYNDIHWVYCTTHFSNNEKDSFQIQNPPSSLPFSIIHNYYDEIKNPDRSGLYIKNNKKGLKNGVKAKFAESVIDEGIKMEIQEIIQNATLDMFKPLLYIIPYSEVKDMLVPIPIKKKPNPLSKEFKIEALPRSKFTIISFMEIFSHV